MIFTLTKVTTSMNSKINLSTSNKSGYNLECMREALVTNRNTQIKPNVNGFENDRENYQKLTPN